MGRMSDEQIKAMLLGKKPTATAGASGTAQPQRPITAGATPAAESPIGTQPQAAVAPPTANTQTPAPPAAAQTTQAPVTPQAVTPAPAVTPQPTAPAAQAPATIPQAATPAPAVAPKPTNQAPPAPVQQPASAPVSSPAEKTLDELLGKDTKSARSGGTAAKEQPPSTYDTVLLSINNFWNTVKSKKNKLIAVGISALAVYFGSNIALNFYDVHTKNKAEQARLLEEKKDNEARKERNARKAEEKKNALKAKEEAKEKRITSKAAQIAKRCSTAAASQPLKDRCDKSKWDPLVCMTEDKKSEWKRLALMHEQGPDFKNAGLVYIEIADVGKANTMISECGKVKPSCANELREESDIMAKALARNIGKKE